MCCCTRCSWWSLCWFILSRGTFIKKWKLFEVVIAITCNMRQLVMLLIIMMILLLDDINCIRNDSEESFGEKPRKVTEHSIDWYVFVLFAVVVYVFATLLTLLIMQLCGEYQMRLIFKSMQSISFCNMTKPASTSNNQFDAISSNSPNAQ